jgi:hypothetical protein
VALKVAHLKSFPDYVACDQCKASFVAEDGGERVLYGNIPEAYPQARGLALRKWATLAQVEAAARADRPVPAAPRPAAVPIPMEPEVDRNASLRAAASAAVPIPTQPEIARPPVRAVPLDFEEDDEPEPDREEADDEEEPVAEAEGDAPLGRLSRLMAGAPEPEPMSDWAGTLVPERIPAAPVPEEAIPPAAYALAPASAAVPRPAAAPAPAVQPAAHPPDPIPGQRFRVLVRGEQVVFPVQSCAHCAHTPAPNRLVVVGTAAQGQAVGQRRQARYAVPLCRACYRRAAARTPEANNARLNAHLVSALVALALLVVALGTSLIDPARLGMGAAALFALILGVLGYAFPATVLLGRAGRLPPPEDARYVRTTLLIPADSQGLEQAFEWRNARYAEQFHQANQPRSSSGVVPVRDRTPTG